MKLIRLTKGQFAMVDDDDFERLSKHKWYAQRSRNTFYAQRNVTIGRKKRRTVHMHREVTGTADHLQCDHIDGNGLNNQRSNLRECTHQQNRRNTQKRIASKSRFIGVTRRSDGERWVASIKIQGKRQHLGSFLLEEDAARARDSRAKELFGEFAALNFPEGT